MTKYDATKTVEQRVAAFVLAATMSGTLGFRVGPAQAAPDLDHLDATRRRPLFTSGRRPPPALPAAPAAVPLARAPASRPPPNLQLNGVIIGPDRTFAIVRRADARLVSLEVGREIDGWSVAAIRPRAIDLRRGDQVATISLPSR